NRNLYLGGGGVPGLSQNLLYLVALNNQIAWIGKCYETYAYTGDTELPAKASQSRQDEKTLYDLIDQIALDPTKFYNAPALPSLLFGSPKLTFSLPNPSVIWGCANGTKTTGSEFKDVTNTDILNQVRPKSIILQ